MSFTVFLGFALWQRGTFLKYNLVTFSLMAPIWKGSVKDKILKSNVQTSPAPESTKIIPALWMPFTVFLGLASWQRGIFWKCYFVTYSLMAPERAFSWTRSKVVLFRHHLHQNPPKLFQHFGCLAQSSFVLHFGRGEFFLSISLSHFPWWHLVNYYL